jgi:acyl dehydratase
MLEYESVKHVGPTFHGDTIYVETTVLDKRESKNQSGRGIVSVETRAFNQRDETVLNYRRKLLVPKRDASDAEDLRAASSREAVR